MSKKIKKLDLIKKAKRIQKNNQFIACNLIQCNENNFDIESMKKGYMEMAEINLELSRIPFEYGNADINEYENWLCGV